jgi:hypothetical protein
VISVRVRSWIGEVEAYLQGRYDHVRRASNQKDLPAKLAVNPPLHETEAEYFVRGLEKGIFSVDNQGHAQSPLLLRRSRDGSKQTSLQLFWHRKLGRPLFREGVCQLSTAASLILKYGWRVDQVEMEPKFPDSPPHLAWAVDLAIKDAEGKTVACGEVKRNDKELRLLIDGFRHCCGAAPHHKDECRFKKNHPKYELCSDVKAPYFLATAPGREICLTLTHNGVVAIQRESQGLIFQTDVADD